MGLCCLCGFICTLAKIALVVGLYILIMNIVMRKSRKKTGCMMMTFGRGGHTAEMMYMCQKYDFKKKFKKVYILVADDDDLSIERAYTFWKANNVLEI